MPQGKGSVEQLARNSSYSLIQTVGAASFGLATSIVLGRLLGTVDYGWYAFFMWLVGISALLATGGLPSAVTRYVAEHYRDRPRAAIGLYRHLVKLEALLAAGFTVAVIGYAAFVAESSTFPYYAAAAYLFPVAIARLQAAALAGVQAYRELAIVGLVTNAIGFGLSVAAVVSGVGIPGLLLAQAAAATVQVLLFARMLRPYFNPSAAQPGDEVEGLNTRALRYARTIFFVLLIDAVVWQKSEVIFLRIFSTPEQIAFYSLAFTITYSLMQVPVVMSNVLFPFFAESAGRDNLNTVRRGFRFSVKFLALLAFPIGGFIAACSPALIGALYGEQFSGTVVPLLTLLAAGTIATVHRPVSLVFYSTEHQGLVLKVGVLMAVCNLGLDFLLIPRFGANGAAFSNGTTQLAATAIGLTYLIVVLGYEYPLAGIVRVVTAALGAAVPVYVIVEEVGGIVALLIGGLLYPASYLLLLRLLRVVSDEERSILKEGMVVIPGPLRGIGEYSLSFVAPTAASSR